MLIRKAVESTKEQEVNLAANQFNSAAFPNYISLQERENIYNEHERLKQELRKVINFER